jgi:NADH dehydrogenase FAD-containing subunit
MDILHLVDRLEELFNESRPIPLTHSVILDEDRILEIIDQMRISIPEEVKKAQQVLAQRDRVMAQAQEEATRTLSLAKRQTEETISKDTMVQAAQTRAEQILSRLSGGRGQAAGRRRIRDRIADRWKRN